MDWSWLLWRLMHLAELLGALLFQRKEEVAEDYFAGFV